MYRHRIYMTARDIHGRNEALEVVQEMNGMAQRLNQPSATVWSDTVGVVNRLVVEIDYETLADFEAGQRTMAADPEWPVLLSRLNPLLVGGKTYTELLESATRVGGPKPD